MVKNLSPLSLSFPPFSLHFPFLPFPFSLVKKKIGKGTFFSPSLEPTFCFLLFIFFTDKREYLHTSSHTHAYSNAEPTSVPHPHSLQPNYISFLFVTLSFTFHNHSLIICFIQESLYYFIFEFDFDIKYDIQIKNYYVIQ